VLANSASAAEMATTSARDVSALGAELDGRAGADTVLGIW
jgi:hypothetical protein